MPLILHLCLSRSSINQSLHFRDDRKNIKTIISDNQVCAKRDGLTALNGTEEPGIPQGEEGAQSLAQLEGKLFSRRFATGQATFQENGAGTRVVTGG